MGWKSIKTHYGLENFIVQVEDGAIHIGSGYLPDLIVIKDGKVTETFEGSSKAVALSADLQKDPDLLRQLCLAQDTFERSLPVYTFERGRILEEFCEAYGYPNVTHTGKLMYENQFFSKRKDAVAAAHRNAESAEKHYRYAIAEVERKLEELREKLAGIEKDQRELAKELGPKPE
jgi:hypothetical protein